MSDLIVLLDSQTENTTLGRLFFRTDSIHDESKEEFMSLVADLEPHLLRR